MMSRLLGIFFALAAISSFAETRPIMLILSPHDLADSWRWYAARRQENHPEVAVLVQDTAEIYARYAYRDVRCPPEGPRTDIGVDECRYPCESIYRWLLDYRAANPTLRYLVLGGAWLDVTDPVVHYLQDGSEITLGNAIPSMRVKPNIKDGHYNPTDMYYACLSKNANETGHHWDANDNGIYLEGNHSLDAGEEAKTKGWADIAVSRMSMKPVKMDESVPFNPEFELVGGNRILNQHQLITNFLYKVNRAEGKGVVGRKIVNSQVVWEQAEAVFPGNHKLAVTSSYLVEPTRYLNDPLVLRDENEFFDGVPNMYAPEHPAAYRDTGPHVRRHVSEITAFHRPVYDVVSFHQGEIYGKGTSAANFAEVFSTTDREIGTVNGHGWAGGTGWYAAKTFSTCTALTKINVVGISCETGYLDHYGNQNGKSVANLSLGESGMANVTKTGGFIASINNTRYGWVNWETDQLFGINQSWRLHYWMYDGVVRGLNAGEAWLRMANNYYNDFGYSHMPPAIPGQCYTQTMLFGDPLIAVVPGEHPNAVMDFAVTQGRDETNRLERAGGLRVMRGLAVSGGTLEIACNGGIGGIADTYATKKVNGKDVPDEKKNAERPNGLVFASPGEVVFDNTAEDAYYFVNKIVNAKKITFAGAGAVLNTDQFDATLPDDGLIFAGRDGFVGKRAPANVIRANLAKKTGLLNRFLPLSLTNTALTLETYEAFVGYAGSDFATLDRARLTFRVNRWRGLTDRDYCERIRGAVTLNDSVLAADYPASIHLESSTVNVSGNSAIETTHGGVFNLNGPMCVALASGSELTLDAEIRPAANAAMSISGAGRVVVKNAKSLVGAVEIGSGVVLELGDVPLVNVTRLTLASNTRVVLPGSGDFYQILPPASALQADAGVTVWRKDGDGVEEEVDAEITPTGVIFKKGTIRAWDRESGTWDDAIQYFPDVIVGGTAIPEATVRVAGDVNNSFLCFANPVTAYVFSPSVSAIPTMTFDSLSIPGVTRFELPTVFNSRLYVAGGSFVGTTVRSPLVEVAAGGSYEAATTAYAGEDGAGICVRKNGAFVLAGAHAVPLAFEADAVMRAKTGKALIWTDGMTLMWPTDGNVCIDVSELALTEELTPIITGVQADMGFLRHLTVSDSDVSLALNAQGDVCVFRCGAEDANWTRDEVVVCETDHVEVTYTDAKRFATLTFTNTVPGATLRLTVADGASLLTDEVRFNGFSAVHLTNLGLGSGTLFAAPETHLYGDSSGCLSMTGNETVYLHNPTEPWTLAEGVQGTIYVTITARARAERQPIFVVGKDVDWPIGGLTVKAVDSVTGEVNEDFSFVREGDMVYLVPPGIRGFVSSAGETTWSAIQWLASDGQPVAISDWQNVYSVEIVSENDAACVVMDGAPKLKLVTSGNALTLKAGADPTVVLPSELVFDNVLTIRGPILPALDCVTGVSQLVLDTGSVTEILIPGSIMPIEAPVEIAAGSTLRLAHETYFQNRAADFRYLSGAGTLEIKDVSPHGARFFMPTNDLMCPTTLSFKLETELELQRVHCDTPLTVGNLNGSGTFGYGLMNPDTMLVEMGYFMSNNADRGFDKWKAANCGTRVMKTIQSAVSEWTGWMPDWYGMNSFGINFNVKLAVAGSATQPDFARRLVYSGTAANNASLSCQGDKGANHDVTVEPTGCFELNGYWNGTIVNNGILVLGPNRVITAKTSFDGNGKVATLGGRIDLTGDDARVNGYMLAAGTYGEIVFALSSTEGDQSVIRADAFEPAEGESLTLVAVRENGTRLVQAVTAANFVDGNLIWLADADLWLDVDSCKEGVAISGSHPVHLFSASGATAAVQLTALADSAKIIIENGVELIVEMSEENPTPLKGHEVEVLAGGRLVIKQTTDMSNPGLASAQVNLSNIKGTGTLEFRSANPAYKLKLASSRKSAIVGPRYWDERLSICINTQIQLYSSYTQSSPLVLRNLSGSGSFYHYGGAELNYVELIQTQPLAFTGTWPTEARITIVNRMRVPKVLFR